MRIIAKVPVLVGPGQDRGNGVVVLLEHNPEDRQSSYYALGDRNTAKAAVPAIWNHTDHIPARSMMYAIAAIYIGIINSEDPRQKHTW
jgi:hypothetical protein